MAARSQATRPVFTDHKINQYLEYIGFPDGRRLPATKASTPEGLVYLDRLVKYQLAKVPFESLDLHYSTHHAVSLDIDHIFHKVVERRAGRGGYCMENNLFFGTILRSMGFSVMPVGARVSSANSLTPDTASEVSEATYGGFTHTVNIVTIGEEKYFVDVGFGSRGPLGAVRLAHGVEGPEAGDSANMVCHRLVYEHIPENTGTGPEQRLWVYKARYNSDMPWLPVYCFVEIEFTPLDFMVMNYFVSHSPACWFTYTVCCQKFLLDEETEQIVGELSLFGTECKERKAGKSRELMRIESEMDRVQALLHFFGVKLEPPEINGIKQWVSMIK